MEKDATGDFFLYKCACSGFWTFLILQKCKAKTPLGLKVVGIVFEVHFILIFVTLLQMINDSLYIFILSQSPLNDKISPEKPGVVDILYILEYERYFMGMEIMLILKRVWKFKKKNR